MTGPLDILIVGGGIAGCSAAIALANRGHRIRLVEKQAVWKFQSSGIFVYANGLVSLEELGLLDGILAAGFAIPGGRNAYYDHTGKPIVETVYPTAAEGRIPAILGIKRAELHRVMAGRVADLGIPMRLGTTVTALSEVSDKTTATFSDGTTSTHDLVIAADGVNSSMRQMIGVTKKPRYTGFGVWRSVHPRPVDLRVKVMMMGPGKRFGIMPISDDKLYTFGTLAEPKGKHFPHEDWPDLMRAKFAEFKGPATPYLEELSHGSEILFTAVQEVVLPLPWHRGRVVLIGDAAHASTPFMGQGGAMAMQDALVLADAIDRNPGLEEALTAFGQARLPVCQFVQDVSRAVGDAGAREHAGQLDARDAELRLTAQTNVDQFYERLADLTDSSDLHQ